MADLFVPPSPEEIKTTKLFAPPTKEKLDGVAAKQVPQGTPKDNILGGFGVGLAESVNPLNIPRSLETIGRAAYRGLSTSEPQVTKTGVIVPVPTEPAGETFKKADQASIMPDLSVKKGIEYFGGEKGKQFVESLNPTAETAGGLAGLILSLGRSGYKALTKSTPATFAKQAKTLLREDTFTKTILDNPDAVLSAMKQSSGKGEALANVADKLSEDLTKFGERLGKRIGEIKAPILKDTTPSIPTGQYRDIINNAVNKIEIKPQEAMTNVVTKTIDPLTMNTVEQVKSVPVQVGGYSIGGKEAKVLSTINKIMEPSKLSPSDVLKAIETIDGAVPFTAEEAKNAGWNINAWAALREIRSSLKDSVRSMPGFEEWKKADDAYAAYKEATGGFLGEKGKLTGEQKVSFLNNILSEARTPTRQRLSQAIDMIPGESSDKFYNELNVLRAGARLKQIDVQKFDPDADQVRHLIDLWKSRGLKYGGAAGAAVGAKMAGVTGAAIGSTAGGVAGSLVGERIGIRLANPMRLIDAAKKSGKLSENARMLADNLGWIGKKFGNEGMQAFYSTVGPSITPLINEIAAAAESKK